SSSPYPPRAPPPPTPVPYTPLFRSLARLQLRRHPRLGDRLIKERLAVDPQLAVVHIILARRVRLDQLVPFTPLERPQTDGNLFRDRKSTRLNSSHVKISYAVFCLKK